MSTKLYFMEPTETIEQLFDYFFPPYITLAHMFHAPEGWGLANRSLKQYQLQYVLKGRAVYRINDMLYETKQGDLIFHGPHEQHSVQTVPNTPYVCISVVFHFGNTSFPARELLQTNESSHLIGNFTNDHIEKKLSELTLHYQQAGLYQQLYCQNLLMQILLDVAKVKKEQADLRTAVEPSNKAKLILVRNFISTHYKSGFIIKDLENITGWSRNYIISQFRTTFGITPLQYLVWFRIEKAKELALQSGMSFSEIANEVGYANVHTLGRIFKRKTGMSLSDFCATLFVNNPDK